jgi:precorrin-6x reductase
MIRSFWSYRGHAERPRLRGSDGRGGTDAIERLSENANIELLITSGMDGYELARRATAARPGLQVIMVSGPEIDGRGLPVVRKPFCRRIWRQRSPALRARGL